MNLCFNCGKSSPTQICGECEEMGCFKNRPADPCTEEYQALTPDKKPDELPSALSLIYSKGSFRGIPPSPYQVSEWMVEFAQIHVYAALKAASEHFDTNEILNSYPSSKIK